MTNWNIHKKRPNQKYFRLEASFCCKSDMMDFFMSNWIMGQYLCHVKDKERGHMVYEVWGE